LVVSEVEFVEVRVMPGVRVRLLIVPELGAVIVEDV
jgi:hypothetical protein